MRDAFVKLTGLDLWHSLLGQVSNKSIQKNVGHSFGMKDRTIPRNIPRGTNCPDCMIGKCQRQNAPAGRVRAKKLLEQVNWDLMMVNEISFEGYRYAIC